MLRFLALRWLYSLCAHLSQVKPGIAAFHFLSSLLRFWRSYREVFRLVLLAWHGKLILVEELLDYAGCESRRLLPDLSL